MTLEFLPTVAESFIKTVFTLSFKTSINKDTENTCDLPFTSQIPTSSPYLHIPIIALLSLHGSKKPSIRKKLVPLQVHYQLCMYAYFCASTLQGVTDTFRKLHRKLIKFSQETCN